MGSSPRNLHGFVKISSDNGTTWSDPLSLPENILGPAKCKPLVSEDKKDLICGASFQKDNKSVASHQDGWASIDVLKNFENEENFEHKECWEKGKKIAFEFKGAGSVIIQPAIWQDCLNPQVLHMLCRASTGKLVYSCSNDFGKTWASAVDSELPSNYSAIDILKTVDNRVFMVWNPLPDLRWKLAVSELVGDDPKFSDSWKESLLLESDEENKKSEYSFPSIIPCGDRLFIAYGINRRELILAEVVKS
jgi:hypothetical protein